MPSSSICSHRFMFTVLCLAPTLPGIIEAADAPQGVSGPISGPMIGPGAAEPSSPADWYGAGVRPTEKRSPEEERLGFHLPAGFEIELVAAEPQIAKPLNMAFDATGKLWITQTIEYPYPVSGDSPAGDCIKTLEDTNGDGQFDRTTTFADGLNIPIGLLPFADGVIAFSIPNLWHLRDTDGDGVCDRRELVLGPFDTSRDTHGMVNALRRGDDGWIYACHGFSNQSTIAGHDGHQVSMTSGNTFRFRTDGSRVESFTSGQVNPFGMTVDRWGNRFTADCHSKPITCLVRGACYPSFGRPHDGLGFFPSMMDHTHGSTAISGICLYDADQFPEAYRNQLYSGNVMTSRINRDSVQRTGATFVAHEVGDFLTSDDPWFRPVDIQLGPDGALYVADFYNRIIGHYEVPLEHPGRDRLSGRIWRIRYRDATAKADLPTLLPGPADDAIKQLFTELASSNAARRRLALDALTDQHASHREAILKLATTALSGPAPLARTGAMWWLHRNGRLTTHILTGLLQDPEPAVRQHALRAWVESEQGGHIDRSVILPIARSLLDDQEPLVVCAAAQAIAVHGEAADALTLLNHIKQVAATDPMQVARLRISLRDLMAREPDSLTSLQKEFAAESDHNIYLNILLGLKTQAATDAIIQHLQRDSRPITAMLPWIEHAAHQADDNSLDRLIEVVRQRSEQSSADQNKIFSALKQATTGRTSKKLVAWADSVASESLARIKRIVDADRVPIAWHSNSDSDWGSESRKASDQQNQHRYCSSFTLGEQYLGVLQSDEFVAEGRLEFWLVGHNGPPQSEDAKLNQVRLVDASTGQTLHNAFPPRSDIASQVSWDLTSYSGRLVRIEVIDAYPGKSYAWIGIGRFDPPQLDPLSAFQVEWNTTLQLVSQYRLDSQVPTLRMLGSEPKLGSRRQLQAIRAVAELTEHAAANTLAELLLRFPAQTQLTNRFLAHATATPVQESDSSDAVYKTLTRELASGLAQREQLLVAQALASHAELSEWLIDAMEQGWLSPSLLHNKSIETSLGATLNEAHRSRLTSLQQNLGTERDELTGLRAEILKAIQLQPGDTKNGQAIFQKQCALCHQLSGQGSLVGPQLDGVGARGAERLLEDILLPDRNVDKAFRTTSFLLDDGTVRVGLIRMESDTTIELIENSGQVRQLEAANVISRRQGTTSLMPEGQHETLGVSGLVDLLAYLEHAAAQKAP